jgi:hypothetical protein
MSLTSVDLARRKGYLHEFDRRTGRLPRRLELTNDREARNQAMHLRPRHLLTIAGCAAAALMMAGSPLAARDSGQAAVDVHLRADRAATRYPARILSVAAQDRAPAHPFPGFIRARAVANYQALLRGTKRLEDLDGMERREIAELQREIRAMEINPGTPREQCIAEQTAARGGSVTDLAARIIDLACSQR